jgi:ABC-type branched-subunit amino acid transport system ATPase component
MTSAEPTRDTTVAPSAGTIPATTSGPAPAGEVLLRLTDVHTYYGHIHALQGISLDVRTGEIVTLLGANGAGKTTTLKTIHGLLRAREGRIDFDGRDISTTPAHQLVRLGIGQSPEGRRIFSRMTVLENLQMGAFSRRDKANLGEDCSCSSRVSPSGARSRAARCPAASSRCWQSGGR